MAGKGKEPATQNAVMAVLRKSKNALKIDAIAEKIERTYACTYQTVQALITKGLVVKVDGENSRDVAFKAKGSK